MTINNSEIKDFAKNGADSVFQYIKRTAEYMENDCIRWLTKSYSNEPQYSNILFDGVSGISFFLSDYYRLTGSPEALELAKGAIEWSINQDIEGDGLLTGNAGIALAYLQLATASNDPEILKKALDIGYKIQESNFSNVVDIFSGVSGIGLFLTKLAEVTQDKIILQKAINCAEWMEKNLINSESGYYWSMVINGKKNWSYYLSMIVNGKKNWDYLGFGHGISGDAYFLILLYKLTRDNRWKDIVEKIAKTLDSQAKPDKDGLNWPAKINQEEIKYCQWCHGSPGIGLFYIKAYEVLGNPEYLKTAELAGEHTFNSGDIKKNPSQCHGLSGNAELLLELYQVTKKDIWLQRAYEFAKMIKSYEKESPEGILWQADKEGFYSPDFWCGASGAGHFFIRLASDEKIERPLG